MYRALALPAGTSHTPFTPVPSRVTGLARPFTPSVKFACAELLLCWGHGSRHESPRSSYLRPASIASPAVRLNPTADTDRRLRARTTLGRRRSVRSGIRRDVTRLVDRPAEHVWAHQDLVNGRVVVHRGGADRQHRACDSASRVNPPHPGPTVLHRERLTGCEATEARRVNALDHRGKAPRRNSRTPALTASTRGRRCLGNDGLNGLMRAANWSAASSGSGMAIRPTFL